MRIYIIHKSALIASALLDSFKGISGVEVGRCFAEISDIKRRAHDVVFILHYELQKETQFRDIRILSRDFPDSRIVIIDSPPRNETHRSLWETPTVKGIIYRDNTIAEARAVVAQVMNKISFDPFHLMPASGDSSEIEWSSDDDICTIATLSNMQRSVYELIRAGKTLREVSDILKISYETTKTHARRVYSKTGTHNKTGVIKLMTGVSKS